MRLKTIFAALAVAAAMLVTGCGEDGGGKEPEKPKSTTYTIKISDFPDLVEGATMHFYLFEYNELGEKIANNKVDFKPPRFSDIFVANKNAVKVKVYNTGEKNGVTLVHQWIQTVYYLEEGKNIDIVIKPDTPAGQREP